jgi:glycosyltransferase involved in cell wall biosynthesis
MTRTIAIDAVGINRVGGGRTSILNLLQNVFAIDGDTRYLVLLSEQEPTLGPFPNVEQIVMPVANRFTVRVYMQFLFLSLVRREGIDLVHFTKNLGVFGLQCPFVVTVHDLTALRLKERHTLVDVFYWRLIEPLTVRAAAQVVTVSRDAANDVERFYGIPRQSIEVIYWAPHSRFVPVQEPDHLADLRKRYELPERYILFLGILAKKKNLPTLLRGLARLRAQESDVPDLVVVGRRYPQSDDTESIPLMHQLGLSDHVHFVGSVPDDDLPLFYSASELYVLPSLHEGFGIPCLESMACGTPVIVSGTGALPEIVGDAGLIVDDPMDDAALSTALERTLHDQEFKQDLIRRGFERVAQFSWERSAQKMLEVYRSVLEDR